VLITNIIVIITANDQVLLHQQLTLTSN